MRSSRSLVLLALPMTLAAQMPEGWSTRQALGQGQEGAWWGGGIWSGDGQGPAATLEDSLGLGNAVVGTGVHLEGGFRTGKWDFAGEVLGVHAPGGATYLTLYRSHAWWRGTSGWQAGFEQEPLVWGYGLNGGYLLGESARPFPRMRIESPYDDLHLFRVPLGQWAFQAFMGRLEDHRVLSGSMADPAWRATSIQQNGDPQAPFLMGYRIQAKFGPLVEFHANYLNMWGGTRNGVPMTQGYGIGDTLTAMFGLKDTLAEGAHDPNAPVQSTPYKNKAVSASEAEWGLRVQAPFLARALGAGKAWFSVSRGSKSMGWPINLFAKNPPKYLAKDAGHILENAATGKYGFGWNYSGLYAAPSLLNPNDSVSVQVAWPTVRVGLEYLDTTNPPDTHRAFAHSIYLTGFYYYGDPLGEALGGEARVTTSRIEWDVASRATLCTWIVAGKRAFRDQLDLWMAQHPGGSPVSDNIFGIQESVRWTLARNLSMDTGASWMRHAADAFQAGRDGNGFRWFADLSYRWPHA